MSAPLLWILLPAALSIGLLFLMPYRRSSIALAGTACLVLALLAWQTNIDQAIQIGPLSFRVSSTLTVFGRRFVLDNADRGFLTLVYLMGAMWFYGAGVARASRLFLPVGMGVLALLIAAQAVVPFLYAALLIEVAVLLSIPLVNPPGQPFGHGAQRYLIFMTLALPFILLAGWAAGAIESGASQASMQTQAAILMGLGFAFWLAVFPFYTWVPLLMAEAHPYAAGFVLSFLPGVVLFLALGFLDSFSWLRSSPGLQPIFQLTGGLMVLTGGVWAAFQNDARRIFGYAVILENGFALLSISLNTDLGFEVFATSLAPRFIALALFALALSTFLRAGIQPDLTSLAGSLRRYPAACTALLVAYFSLAGLPLLAEFPVRQALLDGLSAQSLPLTLAVLAGMLGFWAGGLRLLYTLVSSPAPQWSLGEERGEIALLGGGVLVLFLVGLFPYLLLPGLLNLLQLFTHLH